MVVHLLVAVEMHRPDENGLGWNRSIFFSISSALVQRIDEFLARDDALDDLVDLAVEQRLAAGDRYDRARRIRRPPPGIPRPTGAG